mmetsp:Transcript_15824/g.23830  ORF Transcript_15824/g.23830 Transcript_15824/m.23830 type:complete len:206 (-) Transcript_15824:246-863(-)
MRKFQCSISMYHNMLHALVFLTGDERTLIDSLENREVSGEWPHDLSIIRPNDASEGGDRARDLRLRQEAEQANHGEAAVVDLLEQTRRLLLWGRALRELERIEQVEGDRVGERVESGEVSRLATAHVVLLSLSLEHVRVLTPELEEANREDDLPLGRLGDSIPHRLWRETGRNRRGDLVEREADVVRVHDVADEPSHGDTAVLDL